MADGTYSVEHVGLAGLRKHTPTTASRMRGAPGGKDVYVKTLAGLFQRIAGLACGDACECVPSCVSAAVHADSWACEAARAVDDAYYRAEAEAHDLLNCLLLALTRIYEEQTRNSDARRLVVAVIRLASSVASGSHAMRKPSLELWNRHIATARGEAHAAFEIGWRQWTNADPDAALLTGGLTLAHNVNFHARGAGGSTRAWAGVFADAGVPPLPPGWASGTSVRAKRKEREPYAASEVIKDRIANYRHATRDSGNPQWHVLRATLEHDGFGSVVEADLEATFNAMVAAGDDRVSKKRKAALSYSCLNKRALVDLCVQRGIPLTSNLRPAGMVVPELQAALRRVDARPGYVAPSPLSTGLSVRVVDVAGLPEAFARFVGCVSVVERVITVGEGGFSVRVDGNLVTFPRSALDVVAVDAVDVAYGGGNSGDGGRGGGDVGAGPAVPVAMVPAEPVAADSAAGGVVLVADSVAHNVAGASENMVS